MYFTLKDNSALLKPGSSVGHLLIKQTVIMLSVQVKLHFHVKWHQIIKSQTFTSSEFEVLVSEIHKGKSVSISSGIKGPAKAKKQET